MKNKYMMIGLVACMAFAGSQMPTASPLAFDPILMPN